jgi:hypothetical protein
METFDFVVIDAGPFGENAVWRSAVGLGRTGV